MFLLDIKMTIDSVEYQGKTRPKQQQYELKHPKEYKLYWATFPVTDRKQIEGKEKIQIYVDIKFFSKKFKRYKKYTDLPEEDLKRFIYSIQ